uniref:DNA mismatch repair protein S5 domain-containing protein n=1 Tax=Kalanchoe fedtschenkoi TaxID=63787 RepID=A0A7N0TB33_KALFE
METDEPPSPPARPAPPQIRRLDESVINRIAAGEVIQRPVSAVKELIENSLDAHSTSITVVVKDGGLKLIQISDDGHGIRHQDLPILCERHTTSKLSAFEDLQSIRSMGFRGEALASMTYVAHVTVTTITSGQLHGYRAQYKDGAMEGEARACAAVKGTQVVVENLFYNMSARRKTLEKSGDDYAKIVDLMSRFAVHHVKVSFVCRKHGVARADVQSIATSCRLDAIRSVYGVNVAKNLMRIEASGDGSCAFEMEGFVSNSNYSTKKITVVLFINDRLVECGALKRAIEIVYAATLPKASKPFVYMSIVLPPEDVDVNVHPTKREVCLLNQEGIVDRIQSVIESKLRNSDVARTFRDQRVAAYSPSGLRNDYDDGGGSGSWTQPLSASKSSQKVHPSKLVRIDASDPAGRMHAYIQHKPSDGGATTLTAVRSAVLLRRNPKETADLTSVQELVTEVDGSCHSELFDLVRQCTYIGMADDVFALVQHETRLFLANVVNLSKELMYQQTIRRFAHFNGIQLSEPAPVAELIKLALQEEDLSSENDDLKEKITETSTELLKQNAEMLDEYFCVHIDEDGNLSRLPVVLDQYTPDMDRLPEFILTLANDIEWENEKDCFQTISAAIGNFYALHPPLLPNPSADDGLKFYQKDKHTTTSTNVASSSKDKESSSKDKEEDSTMEDGIDQELLSVAENAWAQREWSIQHVLFPAMRLFLKPPKPMATNGTFIQVASLNKLYKVFERC